MDDLHVRGLGQWFATIPRFQQDRKTPAINANLLSLYPPQNLNSSVELSPPAAMWPGNALRLLASPMARASLGDCCARFFCLFLDGFSQCWVIINIGSVIVSCWTCGWQKNVFAACTSNVGQELPVCPWHIKLRALQSISYDYMCIYIYYYIFICIQYKDIVW